MIDSTRRVLVFLSFLFLAGAALAEEKEIPTEPGEPPYKEGDLLGEGGMDQFIDDEIKMNFRLVDGRIRIYFVDKDRLIVEPPFESGSVRFRRNDIRKGRIFYPVARMAEDLGLGSEDRRFVPFIAFTVVTLHESGERPEQVVSFRYNTHTMNPFPVDGASVED